MEQRRDLEPQAIARSLSYLHYNHLAPEHLRARALPDRYNRMDLLPPREIDAEAAVAELDARTTLSALPPSLQSVALHEYGGEVVGANRGMIEFDDLLKRPLEHYKYLLTTVERAALSMQSATLFLDLVFVGSCNAIHLAAFREIPDFQSFKGRIELVRMPLIVDVRHEEALYRERLREAAKHGFKLALVPEANVPRRAPDGMTVRGVTRLSQALEAF